jgi:asparagine synthase (glutamine-hydrolysing)
MCGIAGLVGSGWSPSQLTAMVQRLVHRGPDSHATWISPCGTGGLGHTRLRIIDLSPAGAQPMVSADGRLHLSFNGEIYNYRELRTALSDYPFRSQSDSEVLLAAYQRWGSGCLDRLVGMFAFMLWDDATRELFAARDRFGVKPLYWAMTQTGDLALGSEIKALWTAGVPAEPDAAMWSTFLSQGLYDHSDRTFWSGIRALPPGHLLRWKAGTIRLARWYDGPEAVGMEEDRRQEHDVIEEYAALLQETVKLRFRSDVPVGISVSGGLDSSTLLAAIRAAQLAGDDVQAFTFVTGHPDYDELPWVRRALARTEHPHVVCRLSPDDVPALAESVQEFEDEPYGGIPSLAYARLFEEARARGVIVLLDGQGMDEQWAGYDYYARISREEPAGIVQGTRESPTRPACLVPEFLHMAQAFSAPEPFRDRLRNVQYRDLRYTKLPRALRFNDRVSMRSSVELREPFLDHRLVELALRQPADRKIRNGTHKWLLRRVADRLMPQAVVEAPKRPLQTPQIEWLRGPLRDWADARIECALGAVGGSWLDANAVRAEWARFCSGRGDQSFFVWQWISAGMLLSSGSESRRPLRPTTSSAPLTTSTAIGSPA